MSALPIIGLRTHRALLGPAALLTLAVVFPTSGSAQDLTLVPAADDALTMQLVNVRDNGVIRSELDATRAANVELQERIRSLELALAEAEAQVDVKKSEIDVIKTKKDLAKKQDEDATAEGFEQQQKDEELQKRLLERFAEVAKRRVEWAKAQRETVSTAERVLQTELELEEASTRLGALQESAQSPLQQAMTVRTEITKLEKDMLEAQRDHARKKEDEAKRERRVIDAQLDVVKAREKIRST
ncbi:MAG: hypothetical protein ACR2QM_01730 [Longimicrobiales bacterium]